MHDTVSIQTEEGTRQQRANDLDDIVATTGAAFLGLTVGCARCHDHKFDPIQQRDYYRLTAVFAGVRHGERALGKSGRVEEWKSGRVEEWIRGPIPTLPLLHSSTLPFVPSRDASPLSMPRRGRVCSASRG